MHPNHCKTQLVFYMIVLLTGACFIPKPPFCSIAIHSLLPLVSVLSLNTQAGEMLFLAVLNSRTRGLRIILATLESSG
jgi:hypothetical protein